MFSVKNLLRHTILLFAVIVLASCTAPRGFHSWARAPLEAVQQSGVNGSAVVGYQPQSDGRYFKFVLRIKLNGLQPKTAYHVRFFDADRCQGNLLDTIRHGDPAPAFAEMQETPGVAIETVSLTGNFMGHAEREFKTAPPKAMSSSSPENITYSAIVIYAAEKPAMNTGEELRPVACGIISNNLRGHGFHI